MSGMVEWRPGLHIPRSMALYPRCWWCLRRITALNGPNCHLLWYCCPECGRAARAWRRAHRVAVPGKRKRRPAA